MFIYNTLPFFLWTAPAVTPAPQAAPQKAAPAAAVETAAEELMDVEDEELRLALQMSMMVRVWMFIPSFLVYMYSLVSVHLSVM